MEQEIKTLENALVITEGGCKALELYKDTINEVYSLCENIEELQNKIEKMESCEGIVVSCIDTIIKMVTEELADVTDSEFQVINNIGKRIVQNIKDIKKEYQPKQLEQPTIK